MQIAVFAKFWKIIIFLKIWCCYMWSQPKFICFALSLPFPRSEHFLKNSKIRNFCIFRQIWKNYKNFGALTYNQGPKFSSFSLTVSMIRIFYKKFSKFRFWPLREAWLLAQCPFSIGLWEISYALSMSILKYDLKAYGLYQC